MTMQAMIDEWYPVGLFSQLDSAGRKTALMASRSTWRAMPMAMRR